MRRLETALQRYAWGKTGSDSMVAQLKKSADPDFDVDEDQTYAELWMGTHPNGPSRVMRDGHEGTDELQGLYGSAEGPGMFLIELLETHPHILGDQEHVGDLPFMFKVLSINKALSIQAHPDKRLAERLYATRPDLYKDDNHKPEMAVALSDFEGLCGFRPFQLIVHNLAMYPEFRAMVGAEATAQAFACTSGVRRREEEALRVLFRAFVTANTDVVKAQVNALVKRLQRELELSPGGNACVESNIGDGDVQVVGVDLSAAGKYLGPGGGYHGSFSGNEHTFHECISSNNVGDDHLSSCGRNGYIFADRGLASDPGRHRNAGVVREDEVFEDMVAREIRQEELSCGVDTGSPKGALHVAEDGIDGDDSNRENVEMQIVNGIDGGSGGQANNEEVETPHSKDGGSEGDVETVDGVTDHEDVHTEDDFHLRPQTDSDDKANDTSTSNNSSSSNISTSSGSGSGSGSGSKIRGSGNDRVDDVATISSGGQDHLALWGRYGAATVPVTRGGFPPPVFRRPGWSSSKIAFADITVQQRAEEDLALRRLILRLAREYPGDIGIMMPLLLNYLRMGEGEAFFMAANEPHAYLKGDIMEVMARSDNVVRVALTPKHRDVPLLCEILTYKMGAPPIVTPVQVDQCCSRYTPPIKDFEMLDIQVPHNQEYATPPTPVAALAIVMAGTGFACDGNGRQALCRGAALFVPARTPIVYTNNSVGDGEPTLWVCLARSNLNFSGGREGSWILDDWPE